jgi:thioredoxin reductase (NADPH)
MDCDILIIGAGPAGLSAAIYAGRAGFKTIMLEKIGAGGQMMLTDKIDNYPGFPEGIAGFDLQNKMLLQAKKFGAKLDYGEATQIKKTDDGFCVELKDNKMITAGSVIIAVGASHRTLDVPGEAELASKGVSYCGTCDGPFFRGKKTIVVGGGDSALTEALFIAKFAKEVTIVHRRDRFRAVHSLIKQIEATSNIKTKMNATVEEICGTDNVTGVILKDTLTGEKTDFETDGVFIFTGLLPATNFVPQEILDSQQYIVTNEKMETSIPGLYAAGDTRSNAFRQVICAAADGATAANYAGEWLEAQRGNAYEK